MGRINDLTGVRFGRLEVIARDANKGNHPAWLCKCDCGNVCIVTGTHLKSGHTQSCGCLQKERTSEARETHGMSTSRLYRIWSNMKNRCCNADDPVYQDYGGRGITVCDEWLSFEGFRDWALYNGYADNLTIDRKDNNKGYSPENCRWTNRTEQQNNRRNNRKITYNGETLTVTQWAQKLGISKSVLFARLDVYHWDIEKALEKTGR